MQIIVLGMHRAGTSLATRLINMMGAYFGPPEIALPPSSDNPAGFWERRDVLNIDKGLLRCGNAGWFQVDRFDIRIARNVPVPLAHGMTGVLREMDAHLPWVMKDPRLCLTLPCWLPMLKTPVIVIASRNPFEIAQSLKTRNAIPIEYGLALWEYYAVHTIRNAAPLPRAFAPYEELLAAPVETTHRLYEQLVGTGVTGLTMPATADILAYISPPLRRARVDNSPALPPHRQAIAQMLRGERELDAQIRISPESFDILRTMGGSLSGAPVNP